MQLWPDQTATDRSAPILQWEARCRLVGLLSLMVACAAVRSLPVLPVLVAVTVGYYLAARLPLRLLAVRLRYPGIFLLGVVLVVPWVVGETPLLQVGPLVLYREGLYQTVLIVGRFGCILALSLVLFASVPVIETVRTLRALGVPALLADIALLFSRYLADTAAFLATMQRAARLRGLQTRRLNWRLLQTLAALTGSMLVQSVERSERVYLAMRLRGYGQAPHPQTSPPIRVADWLLLVGTLALAGALALAGTLAG